MARTESRAFDAYFDPTWHGAGAPPGPDPHPSTPRRKCPRKGTSTSSALGRAPQSFVYQCAHRAAHKKEELDDGDARVKDAGTQSTYRESEAQTDPYTPAYMSYPRYGPRGLDAGTFKNLVRGCPPARGRWRRSSRLGLKSAHLEANLPPATGRVFFSFKKKAPGMAGDEEFNIKQKEIDDAHARRLGLLRRALDERDQDREFMQEQRVDTLRQKRGEVRDRALESIQAQRIKTLRKLSLARGRLSQKEPYSAPARLQSHRKGCAT